MFNVIPCATWCFIVNPRFASLECSSVSQHSSFVLLVHMHCVCVCEREQFYSAQHSTQHTAHSTHWTVQRNNISIAFKPLRSMHMHMHICIHKHTSIYLHFDAFQISFFLSRVFASFTILVCRFLLFSLYAFFSLSLATSDLSRNYKFKTNTNFEIYSYFWCTSTHHWSYCTFVVRWWETSYEIFIKCLASIDLRP